jgi:hypothetical protein
MFNELQYKIYELSKRYEAVSKSFRTESITKYTLTKTNTRWEATQRVMASEVTRLIHKMAIQPHLVAESCTICNSRCRWPVRKLLNTPSYTLLFLFPLFALYSAMATGQISLINSPIKSHNVNNTSLQDTVVDIWKLRVINISTVKLHPFPIL